MVYQTRIDERASIARLHALLDEFLDCNARTLRQEPIEGGRGFLNILVPASLQHERIDDSIETLGYVCSVYAAKKLSLVWGGESVLAVAIENSN